MNLNASRISNKRKIAQFLGIFQNEKPSIICFQEINVNSALEVFSNYYYVIVNLDLNVKDNIGIVTLISKEFKILDTIIGLSGRILGVKIENIQIWNVYPQSGTENKNNREIFFREQLCNYMMNWKDHTKYIFQAGDHNCTHRLEDSLNNQKQHIQNGLIKHLKINGLTDGFISVHGKNKIEYSRITDRSSTRIDYIFSNSISCLNFQYVDLNMGLDHRMVIAIYNIAIGLKEWVPRDRFFRTWVISKGLERDDLFLDGAKHIFESTLEEVIEGEIGSDILDVSMYWDIMKETLIKWAKKRENQIEKLENSRLNFLKILYQNELKNNGGSQSVDEGISQIKNEMHQIYYERSKRLVDKIRGLEIEDHVYDIHKLQNQRKFENQKKLNEIKIKGEIFEGTPNVVKAIQKEMEEELKPFSTLDRDAPPSEEERYFLDKLEGITLTNEELEELVKPTTEEEVYYILKNEVDLDSSPGEDGITSRFLVCFWKFEAFRELYIKYLNFTREIGSTGKVKNIGIMVVKNKNVQSMEYEKKRKLTKINKESNIGNGKVWTNRMKKIILPKILPKTQFNCQETVNIVDEVREIRNVNLFLLGQDRTQRDGTIVSIDFKNAYRSTSLRWFNLVMNKLGIPSEFISWFWMMYENLGIMIVVNKYKSDILQVERGFMEGHPPSMAAFVVAMIPLMKWLEEVLKGIITFDDQIHKIKLFADDMKIFVQDLKEIEYVYSLISKFEKISGLEMHRDPAREKCQALPFGNHCLNKKWPEWVTVKNSIKVVGIIFSNEGQMEVLNSKLVAQNFHNAIQKSYGIKGTLIQKVYFVNTYLFSKLWYTAQSIMMDKRTLENLLRKAMDFIYNGENERPVRAINFRPKKLGGLGLTHPVIKARALLVKNMYKDFLKYECDINESFYVNQMYGYIEDFMMIYEAGLAEAPVKCIYDFLMEKILYKNESLIPSRNEKRCEGIKWSLAWKNMGMLKGVNAEEKCFVWKCVQDMVAVGSRIHRKNAEKRCLRMKLNGTQCLQLDTLSHNLGECENVTNIFRGLQSILKESLDKDLKINEIILFSYNHRNKKRLKMALWVATMVLYDIFIKRSMNKNQILLELVKKLDWNLAMQIHIGSYSEMMRMKTIIGNEMMVNT